MKRRTLLTAAAGSAIAAPWVARAQDKYPSKLITWICPYAAGGGADTRSRQVAKLMQGILGQTIIVDNKAGGGGNIGTDAIAKAKPDGYTIGMGNFAPLAVNQALFKKIPFDPQNDLVPIMLIERGPLILMVRNDSPYKTVKDVVAAAKAAPGKLAYASGGIGGTHHLSGALFEHEAGIDMIHSPYKSGAMGANDLMGGQVQLMFNSALVVAPQVKDGKLKLIAQTGARRSPVLPADLPTVAESGLPGFEVTGWFGLFAPANLPREAVRRLNAEVQRAMATPEARDKLVLLGSPEPSTLSPEGFGAFVDAETQRYAKVIKAANLRLDLPGN